MDMLTDIMELARDNLWLTGIMFLLAAALFVGVLSGGRILEVLGAMLRVFAAIFTTPFMFLRRAVSVLLEAEAETARLEGSRVHTLKRLSDIYYFLVLVLCLLIVAAGASAGAMSLYPKSELEREAGRTEQIKLADKAVLDAEERVKATAAPDFQERSRTAAVEARRRSDEAAAALKDFSDKADYRGGLIQRLQEAVTREEVDSIAGDLEYEFTLCPGSGFTDFALADCEDYRGVLERYIALARASFDAADAALAAEEEAVSTSDARQQADAALSQRKAEADARRAEQKQDGFWALKWVKSRLTGMAVIVLATLLCVIVFVWSSALFLDLVSWLVVFMRRLEIWSETGSAVTVEPPTDRSPDVSV